MERLDKWIIDSIDHYKIELSQNKKNIYDTIVHLIKNQ